jgi:hypothetical protein
MSLKLQQNKVFGIDWKNYKIDKRIEKKLEESKSEEEVLVFGSRDGVYCFDGNRVKQIAERDNWVRALAVWNGELYDGGAYGKIYRSMDSKVVVDLGKPILSMLAVPRSVLKGLI